MFSLRFARRIALAVAVCLAAGLAESAFSEDAETGASRVEQIGGEEEGDAVLEVQQADGDGADDALAIEQSPPEAVDICAPEKEALRLQLGVECLTGDTLLLPTGETVESDAVVVNEDGVFLRLDPEAGRSNDELKRLLGGN